MLTKENCSEKEVNFRVLQVLRNILHIKKSEESLVVRNFGTASFQAKAMVMIAAGLALTHEFVFFVFSFLLPLSKPLGRLGLLVKMSVCVSVSGFVMRIGMNLNFKILPAH